MSEEQLRNYWISCLLKEKWQKEELDNDNELENEVGRA
tara:strand:- start:502 stop:615 length:114 start_codon:yes stop_codon:yes gene_type:complete